MAWIQVKIAGKVKSFTTKRKAREYMLRLQANTLQDSHTVQLTHGSDHVKHRGKTYTAGHRVETAEFRGY